MFDPDLYCKACSESFRLSEEKLEEMIFMTETKKRGLRRPIRIAMTAAALAVVMCVTGAAANPEVVQKLWEGITMTVAVVRDDGDTVVIQTGAPEITVEDENGRTVLNINGKSVDITDALARDGKYEGDWSDESATGEITVYQDKTWEVDLYLADGSHVHTNSKAGWVSFSSGPLTEDEGRTGSFTFTDDENLTDAIYLQPEE